MSRSPSASSHEPGPETKVSAPDADDGPDLCTNCRTNVWTRDVLDSLKADAERPETFYPYKYQIFAGDLRAAVLGGCRWCVQLGACIHGHVFGESANDALTINNEDGFNQTILPYGSKTSPEPDPTTSSDADAARCHTDSGDEDDSVSSQLSRSSEGMSAIGSDWSQDPAAVWDLDEDFDAEIYTSVFEITMTFERTSDGLYPYLSVTIESVDSLADEQTAALSGDDAAQVHYCIEDTDAPSDGLVFAEERETSTLGSAQNIARAVAWLREVGRLRTEPSEPPRKRRRLTALPTRLLLARENTTVRVVDSASEVASNAQYTCLSYVWGADQPCMLTTKNQDRFSAGFDLTDLPQTIRDALLVTARLGYKYMWVDALCIMQDSESDKRRELPQMGHIYKNAAVTISAAVASAATEGFLHVQPKDRHQFPPFAMSFYDQNGDVARCVTLSRPFKYAAERDPINARAWTFQELLLSERVISFTYGGVEFADRSKAALSERSKAARSTRDPELSGEHSTLSWELPYFSLNVTREHVRHVWLSIRREYSLRKMTDPGDKLVAIAAVAEELGHVYGEYVAGLWKEDLFLDLQWRRPSPEFDGGPDDEARKSFVHIRDLMLAIRPPRPAQYRAPSWSWAAIDGETIDPTEEVMRRARSPFDFGIVSCSAQPVIRGYPFGAVQSGTLTVRGRFCTSRWRPSDDPLVDECDGFLYPAGKDTLAPEHEYGAGKIDAREPALVPGKEVQCLAMSRVAITSELHGCEGLMLLRMADDVFRRVGFFHMSSMSMFDGIKPIVVSIA